MARKNGKSALASGIALFGLFADVDGAEVYSVAGDREQARIVFGTAKRMVEADEELSSLVTPYKDALEVTATGSVYRCLASTADLREGLNPTLVLFDELHVQPNADLWSVMTLGSGARRNPLVLGITTAGEKIDRNGQDSFCYQLYDHGRRVARGEVEDPSFFFAWWEPRKAMEADHRDPKVWAEGSPGFGDLVDPEDFLSVLPPITPEGQFRTKRTNLFVSVNESWLPFGAWDLCAAPGRTVPDHTPITLGFDGSFSGDSTALVGVTVEQRPHVFVVDAWERPVGGAGDGWRVDIATVEDAIRDACRRWKVAEVACDTYRWNDTIQRLQSERLPMVDYPQRPERMVPATTSFRTAVLERTLTHDGDPRLARHVEAAVLRVGGRGPMLAKEHKASQRHIDLTVAAVMAYDRATQQQPAKVRFISLADALARSES
jgi:phage terminase large subunit-like protein